MFHTAQKTSRALQPPAFKTGNKLPKLGTLYWVVVSPEKNGEVGTGFSIPLRPVVLMKKPCTQGAVPLPPLTKISPM